MNVLIDVEWVWVKETCWITQLAALRVTDEWETEEAFERLVRPDSRWEARWEHMAYTGYAPDEFLAGVDEGTCIAELARFLREDDTLLCWHMDTRRLLERKFGQYMGGPRRGICACVNDWVCLKVKGRGSGPRGLYETAEGIGLETPAPRHQSTNDVGVLRALLSRLGYRPGAAVPTDGEEEKKKPDRRERNAALLSRARYNYIYTPTAKVFHRPECHLMRNAVRLRGCFRYRTAMKGRSPCKVCRPEPVQPEAPPEKEALPQTPERKVVTARLLGDRRISITNVKIVGFCHNRIHPGKMTRKLLEEHDCLGKNCRFFEKNPESTYWAAEEGRRRHKQARKEARLAEKLAARKLADELAERTEVFRSYADAAGEGMLIVRLERERANRYKVFYVSDHPFADGNRFPEFLSAIRAAFPGCSIQLRHIKDVDGHFVTTTEYLARKRK